MRHPVFAIALLLLCATPQSALAKKKAAPKAPVVALFPVLPQGKVSATIVSELNQKLRQKLAEAQPTAVMGDALTKRLSEAPAIAVERCTGEPACIARLGRNARVDEIAYGYAGATSGGARVEINVISVTSAKIERKIAFRVDSANDVSAALDQHFPTLFTKAEPAPLAKANPEPELLPFDELPLAPLAPPKEPPPAAKIIDIAAAPANAEAPQASPTASPTPPYLTYAGLGMGAIGVGLMAAGAYFGLQSLAAYDEANAKNERGFFTLTGQEAQRLQREGDAATSTANALYGIGATAAVVGGILVGLDVLLLEDVRADVTVQPNAANARVSLAW